MTLRELRTDRLLTIDELARRSGVNWQTIARTELGESRTFLTTRRKLLRALGVDLARHREVFGPLRGDR